MRSCVRTEGRLTERPRKTDQPNLDPMVFRLGTQPGSLLNALDGKASLRQWVQRTKSSEEKLRLLQVLYLLWGTGLLEM